jgi:hypothetical protein
MRRLALVLAVLGLAPATAPAASAKGLIGATACGANRCVSTESEPLLRQLMGGDGRTMRAPRGEPFIAIELVHGHDGQEVARQSMAYVPSSRRVGVDERTWYTASGPALRAFRRLTRGVRPFPPERLADAWASGLAPQRPLAGAPPPIAVAPRRSAAPDEDVPAWLIVLPVAAVLAAAGVLAGRRHRPPEAPAR